MSRKAHVAIDTHAQIGRCRRHRIVDVIRDEVVDDGLAARVFEVLAIDEEVAVAGSAPAPVEIEEVVDIIAVANEGMTALRALTRIVQGDALVDV